MSTFSNFKQVGNGLFGIEAFGGAGSASEFGGLVSSIDVSWQSDSAEIKNQSGNLVGKAYFNSRATVNFEMYCLSASQSLPKIGEVYTLTTSIPNLTIRGTGETGSNTISKVVIDSVSVKMQAENYVTISVSATYGEQLIAAHEQAQSAS